MMLIRIAVALLAISAVVAGCVSHQGPRRLEPDGPYLHPATSLEYPVRSGVFSREYVTEYDPDGFNSSGHYSSPRTLLITATVYHYPANATASPPTPEEFVDHFEQVLGDISRNTPAGRRLKTEWERHVINSFELNGLHSVFEFERFHDYSGPVRSHAYLFALEGWYLKFRFTHPADIDEGAVEHEVDLIRSIRWPRPDSPPAA